VLVLFLAKHAAVLALIVLTAIGAGTFALGRNAAIALRGAVGLALYAHAMFYLALIGQLRPVPIIIVTIVLLSGATGSQPVQTAVDGLRAHRSRWAFGLTAVAMFLLALLPPIAFDETLYHLPFVREFARDGALHFLPQLRFPVFPVLHELVSVPAFLLAGDVATHFMALAQALLLVALLMQWGERAGWLAAAIFLGSPLVIHFSTVLYVDVALTLFVAAGFYALDRERHALAGFLLGTACAVKYLGWYFLVAALFILIVRRSSLAGFAIAAAIAALPMTIWITTQTGDPFFPFLGNTSWAHPSRAIAFTDRVLGLLRVLWDVTFARERMNQQPPITPFLIACVLLIVAAAIHDTRARWLVALSVAYVVAFSFLPQDSRYLMPLLPLMSVAAALIVAARWPKAIPLLALIAIAPGLAYGGYRLALNGVVPEREQWLAQRVPEYRALRRGGNERIYVCGGEELKGHAGGVLLGDHFGPYAYNRILVGDIAQRLQRIDIRYLLVAKSNCARTFATGGMELVYEDEAAQLWRVTPAAQR